MLSEHEREILREIEFDLTHSPRRTRLLAVLRLLTSILSVVGLVVIAVLTGNRSVPVIPGTVLVGLAGMCAGGCLAGAARRHSVGRWFWLRLRR